VRVFAFLEEHGRQKQRGPSALILTPSDMLVVGNSNLCDVGVAAPRLSRLV